MAKGMGFFHKLHDKVTPPDTRLELQLSKCNFALGEDLMGNLVLSAQEDFDCTQVRLEVECTESAKVVRYDYDAASRRSIARETTESAVLFSAKPALSNAAHFVNGESRSFPIKFNIPAGGRPTYVAFDRRVTWTIKGVVAVDGRPDATTHVAEIQVVQPTVVASPQVVREVIREVVKVPCRYCQTLFDQLETSCPNCGAKRTA
jgi:hypothetical protein